MKTIALFTILFALPCSAIPLVASWDANPEPDIKEYRVFKNDVLLATVDPATKGASYIDAETEKPSVQVDIDAGPGDVLTVQAVNVLGFVSPLSEPLTLSAPTAPGVMRVRLVVTIERATDLNQWAEVATVSIPQPNDPAAFYRTK